MELGKQFNLVRALEVGGLPDAYLAKKPSDVREYLTAYVSTYLQKEIQQEQWVRNIEPFRRFLQVAAQMNGKILNKSKMSRDIGVNDVTIQNYFEILEDTHLGFFLPSYHSSIRKAQKKSPKFYFVDTGIKRAIEKSLSTNLLEGTYAFGEAFEHWVLLELIKNASYKRLDWTFHYLRTKEDVEIDLVITRPGEKLLLIEIKSEKRVTVEDAKALETLGTDLDNKAEKIILSQDSLEQTFGKTRAMHWFQGIQYLFS